MTPNHYRRRDVYAATDCYAQLLASWNNGPLTLSRSGPVPLSEALGLAVARLLSKLSAPKRISLGAGAAAAKVADHDRPGFLLIWQAGGMWQMAVVPEPMAVAGKLVLIFDLGMVRAELLAKLGAEHDHAH
jgi:hypothetical protein